MMHRLSVIYKRLQNHHLERSLLSASVHQKDREIEKTLLNELIVIGMHHPVFGWIFFAAESACHL